MKSTVLCTLALVASFFAVASCSPSMWMDTSMCPPEDSLPMCHYRQQKCSQVNKVFAGAMGPIATVIYCANITRITPGPEFYMSIGLAFAKGTPEILNDLVTSDPEGAKAIRRCTLTSTALLDFDGSVNRDVLASSLSSTFLEPELATALTSAAYSCPEPVDYQSADLIRCLKSSCMKSVVSNPSVGFPSMPGHPGTMPTAAYPHARPSARGLGRSRM